MIKQKRKWLLLYILISLQAISQITNKKEKITYDNRDYYGEVLNEYRHSFGTYNYANGDIYLGEFLNDKRTRKGTYFWNDGDKYIGEWRNGDMHGYGTYYFKSGSIKEGI